MYALLKTLTQIEQRIRRIEDSLTGASSFAISRYELNALVLEQTRWAVFEIEQAKHQIQENQ
jgi:hypothetical protein